MTWQNGSDRRTNNIWKDLKYFTPSILIDVNYTYSFKNRKLEDFFGGYENFVNFNGYKNYLKTGWHCFL